MKTSLHPLDPAFLDPEISPADDFFGYVNGGWLAENPVPAAYGSWGAFNEVNERNLEILHRLLNDAAKDSPSIGTAPQMTGDYFSSAMDEETISQAGTAPLDGLLARISSLDSPQDLRALMVELNRIGVGPLMDIGIAPDFENADAYLLYVGQGGTGLPERDYYIRDDERSRQLLESYEAHIAHQLVNLGDSQEHAADAATHIVAFETRLAQVSYPAEKMRDVQLTMNRYEASALDDLMPTFKLTALVTALSPSATTVCIDNPGFFTGLQTTLDETPLSTVRDYLRWNLVRAYASALPSEFEEESFAFYGRTMGGQQEMRPRWKRVLDAMSADIGELVSQLYVDEAFSTESKSRCEHMVDHLLSAMGASIRNAAWMSEGTKTKGLEKLAGFKYKIGFPDTWRDYSGLAIERASYAENRMHCAAFEHDRQIGRLGQPVDREEWAMPPHTVNAYYHPLLNEIVFPAGILQPPFFYADADDAVNFGAIGAVIGHEITHGFDDQGSHFDANGSLSDWWTEGDRLEFDCRAHVLVDQFDAYEVADDLHVNGRLTLGENIADLGGLSLALAALRDAGGDTGEPIDGFSPLQRFFMSWATVWHMNYTDEYARLLVNIDPHSPARFRVNAPLSNTPAFFGAFDIAEGSAMRRPESLRAHIW